MVQEEQEQKHQADASPAFETPYKDLASSFSFEKLQALDRRGGKDSTTTALFTPAEDALARKILRDSVQPLLQSRVVKMKTAREIWLFLQPKKLRGDGLAIEKEITVVMVLQNHKNMEGLCTTMIKTYNKCENYFPESMLESYMVKIVSNAIIHLDKTKYLELYTFFRNATGDPDLYNVWQFERIAKIETGAQTRGAAT